VTDEETVKAKLRQLAVSTDDERPPDSPSLDAEDRRIVDRATTALDDLDAASAFLEQHCIGDLERAVETAEQSVSGCAQQGRETLAEYRRLRDAASADQSLSGRGTSLGDGDKTRTR